MGSLFSQCQKPKGKTESQAQKQQQLQSQPTKKKPNNPLKKPIENTNQYHNINGNPNQNQSPLGVNNNNPLNSQGRNSQYTHKNSFGANNSSASFYNPYQSISVRPPSQAVRQSYALRMNKDPSLLFDHMNNSNNIWIQTDIHGTPLRKPQNQHPIPYQAYPNNVTVQRYQRY